MKIKTLFAGVLLLSMSGCYDFNESLPAPISTINEVTFSRSTLNTESLPTGSTVSFHANGILDASNMLLTFSGDRWESSSPILWQGDTGTSTYTALYPVYNDYSYSSTNLYTDKGLEDILIAQDTLQGKQDISLTFKHLFSQLVIHVAPSLQQQIEEIQLTVPITIANISTQTGKISTTATAHTTIRTKDDSGQYSFIIPPMNDCPLTLELVTSKTTYRNQLPAHTFEGNKKYECKLRTSVGIQNAEDLIAFSTLINQKKYSGSKTLDDFGEKVGNDTIFYLMNDIELTEDDCMKLLPIGYHASVGFKHIFEGNGHTISHLTVPDKSNNSSVQSLYSGLFGYITEKGCVKNLNITSSQSVEKPTCKQTSILSGVNNGYIINCSVSGSSITAGTSSTSLGFICANNSGYIINCHTENSSLKTGSDIKAGGIAGNATGYILNCYAYNNTFTTKSGSYTGGIVGMSNINVPLTIENCCVYHAKTYSYFGAITGNLRGATMDYIYYNNNQVYYSSSSSTVTHSYKYNNDYMIGSTPLSTYLNTWIDSIGSVQYPDITFRSWTTASNILPTFR